ncbi:outer membrane protein assembly factor BamB family protein [Streptomyces sp. JV184]|uniref:outer membrane protein assembly factor BamB family protein n=1 Tax=Streptomyces sp. JV184 TaxID=858637 RepID=UPI002E7741BC|nr:PQQ-binding-like beta-propeller repeat protein [Streptomyces sp. JV184]MEE1744512.1 PQQ-binding-like beta-propeller repeat protein [Streptomyces sp. JV184]
MGGRDGHTVSRRRILGLAGAGLGAAVVGTGVAGCGPGEEPAAPGGSAKPGGDSKGGGFTTPPPGTAPEPLWKAAAANTGLAGIDALAVIGGVALVSGDPLVGRSMATGKEKWSRRGVTTPGAELIVGGGTLYLASAEYDGDVVGLDPATGKETWRSRLGKKYQQPRPIAADDRHVYVIAGILEKDFTTPNNVIAAIDTTSGRIAWREQRDAGTEEFGITAAAVDGRLVYTDYRENVTVRDTATGRQVWTKKISRSNNRRFAVHEGLVIVADGRRLRAFDLAGGEDRWSLRTEEFSSFNDPQVLDGVLYASDSVRGMWAVDPRTGKRIWHNGELLDSATQAWQFAKVNGTLYGATEFDEDGGVHAFDAATGKLRWTYNDKSGDIQQWYVAAAADRLAVMHGKRLYALPAV